MIVPAIRTLLLAALLALPLAAANDATRHSESDDVPARHNEATIVQLQAEMASGRLTSDRAIVNKTDGHSMRPALRT